MKRYQQYVRNSKLRPHDFEDERTVLGLPTRSEVFLWCLAAAILGSLVGYLIY